MHQNAFKPSVDSRMVEATLSSRDTRAPEFGCYRWCASISWTERTDGTGSSGRDRSQLRSLENGRVETILVCPLQLHANFCTQCKRIAIWSERSPQMEEDLKKAPPYDCACDNKESQVGRVFFVDNWKV